MCLSLMNKLNENHQLGLAFNYPNELWETCRNKGIGLRNLFVIRILGSDILNKAFFLHSN